MNSLQIVDLVTRHFETLPRGHVTVVLFAKALIFALHFFRPVGSLRLRVGSRKDLSSKTIIIHQAVFLLTTPPTLWFVRSGQLVTSREKKKPSNIISWRNLGMKPNTIWSPKETNFIKCSNSPTPHGPGYFKVASIWYEYHQAPNPSSKNLAPLFRVRCDTVPVTGKNTF